MPRIDPSQLLQTLSVLLAPNGGIKSAGEVPRIVQLMQKFSKKLVSKCVYIHILCASTPDLLEMFLQQKGWDLLNSWFSDAYITQNYFLCGDLVKLFAVCPMTPARLKENVEINQAPKLIRQVSNDPAIAIEVRTAALQVLQKWMSVIRSPASNGAKNGQKRPLSSKYPEGQFVSGEEHESGSDNEAQLDFDNSKDYNPNEDSDGSDGAKRKKLKREDSTDVDDLLGSTEASDDDDEEDVLSKFYKKRSEQKQKDEERRKAKEKKRIDEKKSKSYSKTEVRDKLPTPDKDRIKEVAKKLKEESKSSPSLISSLGRIPKIPKVESTEKKSNGPSFGDMMGGLDSVKSKPKSAPIKNKNKDLLDTFTNQSPIKPKSKSDSKSESKSDKHRSDKEKSRDKDRDRDREKDRHKSRDRDRERDKDKERSKDKEHRRERRDSVSKSSDGSSKHSKSDSDRPKPKLILPEKRSHEDSKLQSPKDDAKKSPKVIKESNFLGDILGDIMKEPPKKKKRRPSDVKVSEKELKDLSQKVKVDDKKEKEVSPDPVNDKDESNDSKPEAVENSDQMEFAEPTSDLPREVRGILVYAKGNKAKKKITWKEDRELVSIEYFELDETERCNVWKEKTFEEMKKKEAMFEKSKFGAKFEEDTEDSKLWKFIPINFEGETKELVDRLNNEVYGAKSDEKKLQESRELRVLKALNFGKAPTDPSEPDAGSNDKLGKELRPIPFDDLSDNRDDSLISYNFWPMPSNFSQPPPTATAIPTNINALLSNISSGLLNKLPPVNSLPPASGPDLSKPPPGMMSSEESALLEAQRAAAAALGLNNSSPNNYPPSNGGYNNGNGYNNRGRGGYGGGHYNNDRGYNNHNRDRYNNREGKRPCKFWMDRGYCREEDRCLYPHPSR